MDQLGERTVVLAGRPLSLADVVAVARGGARVAFDGAARARTRASRSIVEAMLHGDDAHEFGIHHGERLGRQRMRVESLEEEGGVAYGITTGFGELARVRIPPEDVEALQRNLILSHACGVGEPLPVDAVRAMLLLRANALAVGLSGVREELVDALVTLLNEDVTPVVPSRGSLGASGDLVPLAHVALVLIGEGEAFIRTRAEDGPGVRERSGDALVGTERLHGRDALARAGLDPLVLQAKEGLALINGTQMMNAVLALAVHDAWNLVRAAEVVGAMSLEALLGSEHPFDPRVSDARPHSGQRASAANLRRVVAESGIIASHAGCDRVQDAYSLRCMPQVFGAVRTALAHAEDVLVIETGSATDNPLIFPDGTAVSQGNFHGEPLALVAAYLAPAIAELGAMAERRVARLVDPRLSEGLPPFLTTRSGLHSGLMIPQYVAAALVLENQVLAHPAAVGNLPTSANQEDFNSNGAVGALMVMRVLENARRAVAIELLAAAEGLDHRVPLSPGRGTAAAHAEVRRAVAPLEGDRVLTADIGACERLIATGGLLRAVEDAVGVLE